MASLMVEFKPVLSLHVKIKAFLHVEQCKISGIFALLYRNLLGNIYNIKTFFSLENWTPLRVVQNLTWDNFHFIWFWFPNYHRKCFEDKIRITSKHNRNWFDRCSIEKLKKLENLMTFIDYWCFSDLSSSQMCDVPELRTWTWMFGFEHSPPPPHVTLRNKPPNPPQEMLRNA